MKYLPVIAVAVLLTWTGCARKSPAVGTERGTCYGNGTCNQGLLCMSQLCVRPPPADCHKVATRLNFLMLGNYASQSERDAYISDMVTTCKQAGLSQEHADCILSAENRQALSRCPTPLALGDCKRVMAHVRTLLARSNPQLAEMLDNGPALRRCEQRGISKQDEACVLRATNQQELDRCGSF